MQLIHFFMSIPALILMVLTLSSSWQAELIIRFNSVEVCPMHYCFVHTRMQVYMHMHGTVTSSENIRSLY